MEPCSSCGMPHTKEALADALGIDRTTEEGKHLRVKVGAMTKIIRLLDAGELAAIFNRIDGGMTAMEAVSAPVAPIVAPVAPPPAGSVEAAIKALVEATKSAPAVDRETLNDVVASAIIAERERIDSKVEALAEVIAKKLADSGPRTIEVKIGDCPPVKVEGTAHELLEVAVKLLKLHKNLLLMGASGSGKSVLAVQALRVVAGEALAQISCTETTARWEFIGKSNNATGEYQRVPVVDRWEHGGGILIDELDAVNPNEAVGFNEALANGRLATPANAEKPFVMRHESTYVVATANTWGYGSDRMYVGRNQLDAATLDRFGGGASRLHVDYSPAIEKSLCPNVEIRDWAARVRKNIAAKGLRRLLTTRFLAAAHREVSSGAFTWEEARERYFNGWPSNERSMAESY